MNSTIEKKVITPEIAEDILSSSIMEYQRPLRKGHVKFLAKEIKAGRFGTNTISICENGKGEQYLVNGQHTLRAIIEAETPLLLTVEIYKVSSVEQVMDIYSLIDKPIKRTRTDTFRVHKLEEELGLSRTFVDRYARASFYILNNFKRTNAENVDDKELIGFMRDWLIPAKAYLTAIESCDGLRIAMERTDVLTVGLITSKYSEKAFDFWNLVVTDDGLRSGDPRKILRKWLEETGRKGGGSSRKQRQVETQTALRCLISAWNAYIEGREMKLIRILNSSLPFTILDTPYIKVN